VTEINTHNLIVTFGKHRGERWTRIPVSYLVWLVNERGAHAGIAQAELDRRGYTPPSDLQISDHAIDRASLRCRHIWHQTAKNEDEGIVSWLKRMTNEAIEKGKVLYQEEGERGLTKAFWYRGLKLVVIFGGIYPTLKTVMVGKEEDGV
jgi:hypothetical protein